MVTQEESFYLCFPALRNWKTSVGFSVLGVLLSGLARMLLAVAGTVAGIAVLSLIPGLYAEEAIVQFVMLAVAAVPGVCGIAYAAFVYPSYYSDLPLLESPWAISLFNLLFGGVVYGALWNTCLTKSKGGLAKKKGVSYIVYIVLEGQMLLLQFVGAIYLSIVVVTVNLAVA